ncbi:7104_t:CDS:2 [Ambispora gerdemannii]|uniref:7104_t:CDS:1 n=1 Tax=Ambispora gerdemannii TaxID=144530 RepID=A0A9N9DZF7_9GLOM|nr:7104_t:CDS:2 [Ambispora gerdemannii]
MWPTSDRLSVRRSSQNRYRTTKAFDSFKSSSLTPPLSSMLISNNSSTYSVLPKGSRGNGDNTNGLKKGGKGIKRGKGKAKNSIESKRCDRVSSNSIISYSYNCIGKNNAPMVEYLNPPSTPMKKRLIFFKSKTHNKQNINFTKRLSIPSTSPSSRLSPIPIPIPSSRLSPIPSSRLSPIPSSRLSPIPSSRLLPIPSSRLSPIPTPSSRLSPIPSSRLSPIPTPSSRLSSILSPFPINRYASHSLPPLNHLEMFYHGYPEHQLIIEAATIVLRIESGDWVTDEERVMIRAKLGTVVCRVFPPGTPEYLSWQALLDLWKRIPDSRFIETYVD